MPTLAPDPSAAPLLAAPLRHIFADWVEAEWGFQFLRTTLALLGAETHGDRPYALTLPRSHKQQLLRLNFGPWLLLDFCGPGSEYGKRINLALLKEGVVVDPRREWFTFSRRFVRREVAVYHFDWPEVQAMDAELTELYKESMDYIGGLFAHWQGSTWRLVHQRQLFASIYDPVLRDSFFEAGLNPFLAQLEDDESTAL